ncbi:hypothetical protein C8J57DRAFT_1712138 [Mycena rebaudengoi]|nr:hypothetical protein C8J57DRAFT_1712138 [Mycena rebaudengoi]
MAVRCVEDTRRPTTHNHNSARRMLPNTTSTGVVRALVADPSVPLSTVRLAVTTSPFASLASRRRRSPSPIMFTLETRESENAALKHPQDPLLLSPPINTCNAVRCHRPTCSQSAPPTQTAFVIPPREEEPSHDPPPRQSPDHRNRRATTFGYAYVAKGGMTMHGGSSAPNHLLEPRTAPAPPPRTHPPRTSSAGAPTAGLPFDAPMHDLSALCVDSRIASEDGWAAPRALETPQAFEPSSLDSQRDC